MKTIAIGLMTLALLVSLCGFVRAQPFLACDPQSGVEYYDVEVDGSILSGGVPAETDGSIRYDLSGFGVGTFTIRLRAGCTKTYTGSDGSIVTGPVWSEYSVPFELTVSGCEAVTPSSTTITE